LARIHETERMARRVLFRNTAERENASASPDPSEFNRENADDAISSRERSPVLR